MKARQVYIVLGIVVLLASFFGMRYIAGLKEAPEKEAPKAGARKLQVLRYEPDTVRAEVPISGRVKADRKVDLYAEVSGVFQDGAKRFEEGVRFENGEVLVDIEDEEARMNLRSQKSAFLNAITELLPDLKMEFPEAHQRWKAYLEELSLEEPLPSLPKVGKEQVKYFVASRNLYERYYSIESQEARLDKFTIEAPFDGVLSEASLDPGTLVRNGQKLGSFIDPDRYELVASVGIGDLELVEEGDEAILRSSEGRGSWTGRVERMDPSIDQGTQTVRVYIPLEGPRLREGMYLEGDLQGNAFPEAVKIPRKLLQEGGYVWTVRDSSLKQKEVEALHKLPSEVIVRGIEASDKLLEKPFPGAYEGMPAIPVETEGPEADGAG
jgi:membrane fusion protein (multidrug efflux system)